MSDGNDRCTQCDCARAEHGECPKCAGHTFVEPPVQLANTQCRARWAFSKTEDWVCQLDGGHDGAHQWPNPADTLT